MVALVRFKVFKLILHYQPSTPETKHFSTEPKSNTTRNLVIEWSLGLIGNNDPICLKKIGNLILNPFIRVIFMH